MAVEYQHISLLIRIPGWVSDNRDPHAARRQQYSNICSVLINLFGLAFNHQHYVHAENYSQQSTIIQRILNAGLACVATAKYKPRPHESLAIHPLYGRGIDLT